SIVDPHERPTRFDYDRYYYIVRERARLRFQPPRVETEPLIVADVALTAMLCRAEEDLAWLARTLGVDSAASERQAKTRHALDHVLWDDTRSKFHDVDVIGGAPIDVDHIAHLLPLYAGLDAAKTECVVARLASRYAAPWPAPSVPLDDPRFDRRRYWRGPTW